jgi:hypothetical protein
VHRNGAKNLKYAIGSRAEPYVGNIDLRPYYFASKEKEDYFFKQVKSEKLRFIIDGLMGPSMYIAGTER